MFFFIGSLRGTALYANELLASRLLSLYLVLQENIVVNLSQLLKGPKILLEVTTDAWLQYALLGSIFDSINHVID